MQMDPYLSLCTKLLSKRVIESDTLNLLGKKLGDGLEHWHKRRFSDQNTNSKGTNSAIGNWDLMKLKSFSNVKTSVNKTKQ